MAYARKCDRCGECFDPYEQGEALMGRFINPIFQNSEDLTMQKVTVRLMKKAGSESYVDLCPDCTTRFFAFMLGGDRDENTDVNG